MFGWRRIAAALVSAAVVFSAAEACRAQSGAPNSSSYYTLDPYDYVPAPGSYPVVTVEPRWQVAPFDVGYNLLSGMRPVFTGARQPIGHEIIMTHGGNGYVYRPVYAPSPGYHFTPQGPLIIERAGRYPDSPPDAPFPPTVVMPSPPLAEPAYPPTAREF
jgi:hypothetical protein